MPHSLGQVYVHAVFATANCAPNLIDGAFQDDLYGTMAGILEDVGCPSLRVGGVEDHVHALFRLSRIRSIAEVMTELKERSAIWIQGHGLGDFVWENGYGAFSVSPPNVDRVVRYIGNQETFHRQESFQAEYREIVRRSGGLEQRIDVHLVFSTKNRLPFLKDKGIRDRAHDHLAKICDSAGGPAQRVGGIEDHVHILYRHSPETTLARVAQVVKKGSSRWIATRQGVESFDWQEGYGCFSVSPQHVPAVCRYIDNQEEHHRRESFEAEIARQSSIHL